MPPKQNPRHRSEHGPGQSNADQKIHNLDVVGSDPAVNESRIGPDLDKDSGNGRGREVDERGDEANPRGVTTREGEMVGGNGDVHVLIVERARTADNDFDEANQQEVEKKAEEERKEERSEQNGGVWDWGEEERE